MEQEEQILWLPVPRQIEYTHVDCILPADGWIVVDAPVMQNLYFTATLLQAELKKQELHWHLWAGGPVIEAEPAIILQVVPGSTTHPEGYTLGITPGRVQITASQVVGIFYGVQTLRQLIMQVGTHLPGLRIQDHPDYPNRGIMLDISRDRVPTMETLYHLADLFASWKINQLQLYTEHTFAYRQHPVVWQQASPMTGEEILALDAYCRERFIELVPNQNSFGHMRRWLVHESYNHLAECPDGCNTMWGYFDKPFSLCPGDPGSLKLVNSLFDELLPHFSSRQINVGCDETVDLGQGRSADAVKQFGAGRVYLDFLKKIYRSVKSRGYTVQFWGDVVRAYPELVPELPKDVIALEWGYEADHPFDKNGAEFAAAGVPFYVCPGTSSWDSVGGRTENALANLLNAAENGLRHGAIGYLVTDWGDYGHWQPLPVSYMGFAYGGALAWTCQQSKNLNLPKALSLFAFQNPENLMGQIWMDLGRVDQPLGITLHNANFLFRVLQSTPQEIALHKGRAGEMIEKFAAVIERIDQVLTSLDHVQRPGEANALMIAEVNWVADMLRHACWRGIWALGLAIGEEDVQLRHKLLDQANGLLQIYTRLWHSRSRPGGFADSAQYIETMRSDYV